MKPFSGSACASLHPQSAKVTEHLTEMRPLPSRFESCFVIGSICIYTQPIRACLYITGCPRAFTGQAAEARLLKVLALWKKEHTRFVRGAV